MIYGLNFGGTEIPIEIRRKFRQRMKLPGFTRFQWLRLQGVCETADELKDALANVQRPGRIVHVETRKYLSPNYTGNVLEVYGIYVY